MFSKRIRCSVLAASLLAVGAPIASHVYAQTVKCYFKDCTLFENGSRVCQVKEVPCPNES